MNVKQANFTFKEADPLKYKLSDLNIDAYDKHIWADYGFDVDKLIKKEKKDFPYAKLVDQSKYFEQYRNFYE